MSMQAALNKFRYFLEMSSAALRKTKKTARIAVF